MVRRSVKFIKDNPTAVLFGILIILLSINLIIHFYNVDPTGKLFNNWLSPLISLLGFGLVYGTLKQMQKDNRRDISKEKKEIYFTRINSLLEKDLNFVLFPVEYNSPDKINKLDFMYQYKLFKLEMERSENTRRIELIKSGKEITDEINKLFSNSITEIFLFKFELGWYYNSLCSELHFIWKTDLILEHKKIIVEFLADKLKDYISLCYFENFEFLKRVGTTFSVEDFQSGMILDLHQLIIHTPEIRKIFQKYYPSYPIEA